MIIVSQDKYNVLNFDTTVNIGVEEITTLSDVVRISAQTNGSTIALGEYATEQRAKEVLEQIVKAYQASEFYKVSNTDIQASMVETYEKNRTEPFKYEMPAE